MSPHRAGVSAGALGNGANTRRTQAPGIWTLDGFLLSQLVMSFGLDWNIPSACSFQQTKRLIPFLCFSGLILFTCLPAKSWCGDVMTACGLLSDWHWSTGVQPHFFPPPLVQNLGHWARGNLTTAMPNISQEPLFAHLPQPCFSAPHNSSLSKGPSTVFY